MLSHEWHVPDAFWSMCNRGVPRLTASSFPSLASATVGISRALARATE